MSETNAHITFERWLELLDDAANAAGITGSHSADTGPECWRDYYDQGYTPSAALTEDWSYD